MANLRGPIARGEKSGAFALGFSDKMKSVAGAMAVLALATTGTVVVQSQNAPAAANVLQESKAIYSAGDHRANHTVNGAVYVDRSSINSTKSGEDQGLSNVKVYAQWMDEKVKGYAVSPVYTTNTRADGTYTVDFPEWTDSQGNKHLFKANPYQKLRVWIENPDSSKYEISYMEGDGVFKGSTERYASVWSLDLVNGGNVRDQNIALTETPESWLQKPEADWKQSEAKTGDGYINGRVFWDQKNLAGAGDVPQYNTGHGDVAVSGVKVVGSYLRDEVANELDQWKKDNRGYTQLELKQAQQDAIKKFETDNPGQSAIAETVTATTDAQGQYVLQFNGTYGVTSTNIGTWPNAEAKKLFHTVADSAASGRWATSGGDLAQSAAGNVSKHINMDYVYVQPILDESANVNPDNFRTAMFTNPTWNISYATAPKRHAVDNSDFALKPSKPGFDVVDYNTTDKPAFKGTEVQTRTVGLVPNTPYTIQWYDAAGEKVGTTCKLDSDDLGAVPSCPFTVPDTAKAGDVFTAVVELPDGTPFLADSFIVKEPMTDSMDPKYEDKLVVPGEETKSTPTFTDKDGQKVDAPKDAKFSIPEDFKAPEGYEVKIDENTGEVTVTFPDKSKLNKDTAEEFSVPVTVTYPDGTKDDAKANFKLDTDGDGKPDTEDEDDDNDGIPDKDDSNPKVPNVNEHFDPKYEDGSGKPGSDVKIEAPTFTDKDDKDTEAPEGTKFTPGDDAPEGVKVDENTGAITVTIPEGANPGDEIKVPVVVTYPDGTKDNVEVTVTVTDKDNGVFEPKYKSELVVPGKETKSSPTFTDKDGKDAKAPEGSKFTIPEGFTAPEGYEVSIDENTGEITVTVDGGKLNKDTVEEFDVPVTVTYPDGSKDDAKANFKLDTDGDGDPDVTDPDDDGDGIPDEDDSNPKVPNANDHFDPVYEDGSGKPGSDVKIDPPTFKDKDGNETKAPEGTKFTPGENAPEGVTIDENTGEITVPIPEGANPGDKITVPVEVTYPDGSKDTVEVTVTVTDKDAGLYEPKYEDKLVVPGQETKSSPTFTDKDGKDAKAPEGSKFTIPEGFTAPEGYEVSIDENTGEITVTVDGGKLNKDTVEEFDVPVTVTYPDGSKDDAKANFKLDTDGDGDPDVTDPDDDGDGVNDEEEKEKGSNPKDPDSKPEAPAEKPDWSDDKGKPGDKVEIPNTGGDVPEGTTVETEGPGKAEIDENGNLIVDIDKDAKPGDKIEVVVKDKDGNEIDRVVVEVEQPDAPAEKPDWSDDKGKPGDKVEIPNTGGDVPEGTTVETEGPGKAEIDENGNLIVDIDKDAKPGDKIEVVVKDKDGNEIDRVVVEVEEPDAPAKVDYRPSYGDPVVVPAGGSKTAEIAYPADQTAPAGTKYVLDPNYTVPNGWTIEVDETTGKVTATVDPAGPNGARQEELVVPVLVQYPEDANATGNDVANATFQLDTDGDNIPDITDEDDDGDGVSDQEEKDNGSDPKDPDSTPEAPVNDFQPSYEEKTVPAGQSVESPVTFTGEDKPEGTTFSIAENFVAPHGWTFEVDPETGTVTATVVPAGPDGARQEQVIVPIVVTYPDGTATSDDTANAVFNLDTDGDGTPDSKDDDDDGDGFTDEEEKEKGTDPKDPNDKPQPDAPAEQPDWKDDSGKPGDKVEIPNTGGDVPEGATVETEGPGKAEIDENGNLIVDIDKDAKPGDKIVVVVKDKDGNEIDRVVVEVEQPDAPAEQPDWKDDSGKPGDKVEIPNTGGDVPEGATVETEGPGKAEIDENGNLVVDIDEDAKPGDKIEVVVKDKDGNEIDRVVVEVEQPDAPAEKPDWSDDKGKPGDKVEIPNTGGDVPEGATVETEGPGKAEIDENGNLVVDIDEDAKPGDKIEVVVKDKDGNVIDEVTVTVTEKEKPGGSSDLPEGLIPGLIGGGIIGGIIGGNLGSSHGSSTPGQGAGSGHGSHGKGADKGAGNGADKGAQQGGKGAGQSGTSQSGAQSGAAQSGASSSSSSAGRQGSLAVTGVSGVAIMLGAAAMALAIGGALLAGRRRREN
ncbi:YPDG domain-containing protein [Corynebacterium urealyticum]|nr:YPDG domain-containing protein [Corynebacterium urealyticum]QQC42499.1 YPDG domain-containing protein [Corynebacterium urealyticum]SNV92426.1 cell surface protein [Corynebacterium urealyticum]